MDEGMDSSKAGIAPCPGLVAEPVSDKSLGGCESTKGAAGPLPPTLAAGPGTAQPHHTYLCTGRPCWMPHLHFLCYWSRIPIAVVIYKYIWMYMYIF